MGFGRSEVEFLVAAADHGVDFNRTMTLGRQTINMTAEELSAIVPGTPVGYAEPFLNRLGATEVRSLDMHGFGGATDAQDLNEAIPRSLDEQFSVVIDGGTLEHVFNVPEALRSAMRMAKRGGHVVMMTPCNGAPGHGFYQFTPEMLFRVFSRENGYEVRRCLLREGRGGWFNVRDPAAIGAR